MKHLRWLGCLSALVGCGAAQDGAGSAPPARAPSAVSAVRSPADEPHLVPTLEVAAPARVSPREASAPARPPTLEELLATLPSASSSTSIGSPTNGRLEGSVPLPLLGPGFRYNDRRSRDARYGTVETVRAIVRAASVVRDELPGSELLVNDIGLVEGGRISHHGSHRAGRDADILFFLLGDDGKPTESVGAPIDPEGIGFDYKDLSLPEDDLRVHFDAARTWRFVQALLAGQESPVQRIFVVEHLRARLLAEAERSGAPAALIARFADVTCQPSYPHDDHLHVRWYCSVEDLRAGCEDLPPLYPWHAEELAALGQKPVMTTKTRSEEPAPVVTQADAARAVAKASPHADVVAFLKRRKAWEKQPHPGRPYCK
jgi:penicillin-insensitive murein DD-endopeptidase